MKKSVLGLSALVIVGIIAIGVYILQVAETEPSTEVLYKGVWLPGINPNYLATNMQRMKDLGMDTVSLAAMIIQEENNPLASIDTTNVTADIQTAHENGMKVMLTPQFHPKPRLEEKDLEALNSLIIEAAELAEEYDVELFAPLGEPGAIISGDVGKWRQEILPKIKEVYHGEIFWGGAGIALPEKELTEEFLRELSEGSPRDYSGYDYIVVPLLFIPSERLEPEERIRYADRLTLERYSQYVDDDLKYVLALAERDNCKGIIIGFGVLDRFFMGESGVVDMLDMGWLSEEELARAHEIVLEKGKDRAVGFIVENIIGGEVPGMPGVYIGRVSETENEVIRRYFTEIL